MNSVSQALSTELFVISPLLSALLAAHFLWQKLYRLYPLFFTYWIVDLAATLLLPMVSPPQRFFLAFKVFWICRWVLYFLIVMELTDRILTDHPALARLGKRGAQLGMALATLGAVLTLPWDATAHVSVDDQLHLLYQLERIVSGALLLFLAVLCCLFWYFPIRLTRNAKLYCLGFAVYFLVRFASMLLLNTRGLDFHDVATISSLGALSLCQLFWMATLRQTGETRALAFVRHWNPQQQQQALATLQAVERQISSTHPR